MKKKRLPIGISDFKTVIEGDYLYVDKSLLIKEIVENNSSVLLIPRCRRFGKTLNLSMLRYFFEKGAKDTSHLFSSLAIWKHIDFQLAQGKFPVIFLTFKDVKHASWENTFKTLRSLIADEFQRHAYLVEGDTLTPKEKDVFQQILYESDDQSLIEKSLFLLTDWLQRYHQVKVILLIDEYDTPAHAAYVGGFYDTLIPFLRNWLSWVLKDNNALEKGVLTGILRIAKESIFSGLNNIKTCTILSEDFQDKFGITGPEVKNILQEFDLSSQYPEIKKWYNGYRIGSCLEIYNPWSILNCIDSKGRLGPYWVNTSDNAIMKQLLTKGGEEIKKDFEELLKGNVIEKSIEEGIVFADLENNLKAVWSLLLFSGYLTIDQTPILGTQCQLRIPNLEVRELIKTTILEWFERSIYETKYRLLLTSLVNGDIDTFSQIFQEYLISFVSVFDVSPQEPEILYHAFILGMLIGLQDTHEVKSNRESGYGRYDVMLIPKNTNDLGIVMEFKKIGRFEQIDLETAVESALKQIEEKKYDQELHDRGIHRILHLGLAFEGKRVLIKTLAR